nr:hypothetical protein [uncultured Mediterranean phage uvMED]
MNGLIKIDENTTDFSMLYTVPMDSGPNLARARINKDNTTEHNGEMVEGIPAPSIALNHPDYGDVFAKDTYFRIFAETMQTSVYDPDSQKFSNISQHFMSFKNKALDWFGGDKCGWVSNAEREKLRASDPIAYSNASKAKLSRNLFGLIRMDKPVAASGEKVEIDEVPFRIKLGPSNFFEIGKLLPMIKKQYQMEPFNCDIKIGYELKKAGSNKYFVLKYTPIVTERKPLTDTTRGYLQDFADLIVMENEQVVNKMRENMVPSEVKTDLDVGATIDDEIPF